MDVVVKEWKTACRRCLEIMLVSMDIRGCIDVTTARECTTLLLPTTKVIDILFWGLHLSRRVPSTSNFIRRLEARWPIGAIVKAWRELELFVRRFMYEAVSLAVLDKQVGVMEAIAQRRAEGTLPQELYDLICDFAASTIVDEAEDVTSGSICCNEMEEAVQVTSGFELRWTCRDRIGSTIDDHPQLLEDIELAFFRQATFDFGLFPLPNQKWAHYNTDENTFQNWLFDHDEDGLFPYAGGTISTLEISQSGDLHGYASSIRHLNMTVTVFDHVNVYHDMVWPIEVYAAIDSISKIKSYLPGLTSFHLTINNNHTEEFEGEPADESWYLTRGCDDLHTPESWYRELAKLVEEFSTVEDCRKYLRMVLYEAHGITDYVIHGYDASCVLDEAFVSEDKWVEVPDFPTAVARPPGPPDLLVENGGEEETGEDDDGETESEEDVGDSEMEDEAQDESQSEDEGDDEDETENESDEEEQGKDESEHDMELYGPARWPITHV